MIPAEKIRDIRGFNYTPSSACNDIEFWRDYDEVLVEQELTYAQRMGLNSARVFLAYVVWDREPEAFAGRLRHFVRAAHARGISTMPVVWDSCFSEMEPIYEAEINDWIPNPGVMNLGEHFWPKGEQYCAALVEALRDEPGLLIWDVMNEPLITSWIFNAGAEKAARMDVIWKFVRHFCEVFKKLDTVHPTTVGVHTSENLEVIGEASDILSFHDYSPTHQSIGKALELGLEYSRKWNKPAFVSEISCLARANPYDVSIQACMERGLGWFTWELMIGKSMWRDIHGIVYPDGSVRDPSIVAAVQGFFRKREGEIVLPNLNKEGAVTRALSQAADWLKPAEDPYAYKPYHMGLSALDMMANLIEAGEILPLVDLPSRKVLALAKETPENRDEVCRLLNEWGAVLKANAGIN